MTDTPNRGIPYVPEGTLDPAAGLNISLNTIDALLQTSVISIGENAPPGSNTDGDLYIVGESATGAWAGQENNLARYVDEGDSWQFFVAGAQVAVVLNRDDGNLYKFDEVSSSPAWVLAAVGSGGPGGPGDYIQQLAASDLTTDLTTGTDKAYFRAPKAFTLTEVRASLLTASSTGAIEVDILKNGVSLLSTTLTIDQGEATSLTAATPAVIDDPDIDDDDEITVSIVDAGSGARGLIITLIGE